MRHQLLCSWKTPNRSMSFLVYKILASAILNQEFLRSIVSGIGKPIHLHRSRSLCIHSMNPPVVLLFSPTTKTSNSLIISPKHHHNVGEQVRTRNQNRCRPFKHPISFRTVLRRPSHLRESILHVWTSNTRRETGRGPFSCHRSLPQ